MSLKSDRGKIIIEKVDDDVFSYSQFPPKGLATLLLDYVCLIEPVASVEVILRETTKDLVKVA